MVHCHGEKQIIIVLTFDLLILIFLAFLSQETATVSFVTLFPIHTKNNFYAEIVDRFERELQYLFDHQ